jgi:hypothetical protein
MNMVLRMLALVVLCMSALLRGQPAVDVKAAAHGAPRSAISASAISASAISASAVPRRTVLGNTSRGGAAGPPFVAGYRTVSDVSLRIYAPAGRLRIVVWARDSVAILGTQSTRATRFGGGSSTHLKIGVEPSVAGDTTLPTVDWEVMVPARARVWAKMIDGTIAVVGTTVGLAARQRGEFELYTVRGAIHAHDVRGVLSVESIDAPVTIGRTVGDLRVRGGRGAVDLADISGTLSVATVSGAVALTAPRADGRVETIGGAITVRHPALSGKQLELQTHAGAITLAVDSAHAPQLVLSARTPSARGQTVQGSAQYGTLLARSFKGTIRVERVHIVP